MSLTVFQRVPLTIELKNAYIPAIIAPYMAPVSTNSQPLRPPAAMRNFTSPAPTPPERKKKNKVAKPTMTPPALLASPGRPDKRKFSVNPQNREGNTTMLYTFLWEISVKEQIKMKRKNTALRVVIAEIYSYIIHTSL